MRAPSFGNKKKASQIITVKLLTKDSLLSGLQNSTSITQTNLTVFYLFEKTSSAQKSSFTNTEETAALALSFDSAETLKQEKPLKIPHFSPRSCWELSIIGLARSSQKQRQFGIGWDKNHRISQENRSQRTGQRTSVKNGFFTD